jgi:hypothetical protein
MEQPPLPYLAALSVMIMLVAYGWIFGPPEIASVSLFIMGIITLSPIGAFLRSVEKRMQSKLGVTLVGIAILSWANDSAILR